MRRRRWSGCGGAVAPRQLDDALHIHVYIGLYVRLGEKSRVSAVQDGGSASTRKLELEDDLRARVRKLEEEFRALDDKVGATAFGKRDAGREMNIVGV
jgi:hypothetical protein